MKRILIRFTVIASFCIPHILYAQELHIGDKIPDFLIKNIINYKNGEARWSSNFKGKPLIIDFWTTHCGPCINVMPSLDSIQREFGSKLSILLVTSEPTAMVKNFLAKKEKLKNLILPSVTSDKLLKSMFPHRTVPHEVWIDGDGIVRLITSSEQVTRKNLEMFINNKLPVLPLKNETLYSNEEYWGVVPFMAIDVKHNNATKVRQYSYIGEYDSQMKGSYYGPRFDTLYKALVIRGINMPLAWYYQRAFRPAIVPVERIIFDTPDSLKFKSDFKTYKNIYCYNLITKDTSEAKATEIMRQDLDRYFKLESRLEKRNGTFFIARKGDFLNVKADKNVYPDIYTKNDTLFYVNKPWGILLKNYLDRKLAYNIIDETGISAKENITVKIPIGALKDSQKFIAVMSKYGLILSLESRPIDFIVIRDKKSPEKN